MQKKIQHWKKSFTISSKLVHPRTSNSIRILGFVHFRFHVVFNRVGYGINVAKVFFQCVFAHIDGYFQRNLLYATQIRIDASLKVLFVFHLIRQWLLRFYNKYDCFFFKYFWLNSNYLRSYEEKFIRDMFNVKSHACQSDSRKYIALKWLNFN